MKDAAEQHPALVRALEAAQEDPRLSALVEASPKALDEVGITEANIGGKTVYFATDMERDPIQRRNRRGKFFEPDELELIKKFLPDGGTFVDIGSNIGNHSVFAGLFAGAGTIVPVEPNPLAYRLLTLNLLMNGLADKVDWRNVGFGASDRAASGFAMTERHKNLGAAQMVEGEGDISTIRPDEALADMTPDFIKIDVEGMEMSVLAGLEETVLRARPVMLIEVDMENVDAFEAWRIAHQFEVVDTFQHYKANINYVLTPEERA